MGVVGLCAMIRVSGEIDTRRASSRHFESFKSGREVRNLGEKLAKEEMGEVTLWRPVWDFPWKSGRYFGYFYILWTAFNDIFGYCGVLWKRGGIFPGKMGKVPRLVWGSPG